MRPALVLNTESARHPFRAAFAHTDLLDRELFEKNQDAETASVEANPSRLREDFAFFLVSYVSGLIIFFGMIA